MAVREAPPPSARQRRADMDDDLDTLGAWVSWLTFLAFIGLLILIFAGCTNG